MSTRGGLFLGDLVKAVSSLRPRDEATAVAMARLLGLGPGEPESLVPAGLAGVPVSDPDAAPGERDRGGGPRLPPPLLSPSPSPSPSPDGGTAPDREALPERPAPDEPEPLGEPSVPAPRLLGRPVAFSLALTRPPTPPDVRRDDAPGVHSAAGELPGEPVESTSAESAPAEPPWTPEWARGVMVAAVSAPVVGRRLDQHALIRKVSRQEVVRDVPWQRRPSTRRGVQLLLDHSPGMAPFQHDRRWLHALTASVAGRDRVEVLRFTGSPRRGVVHPDSVVQESYRAPAPGTPVVVVSDLGRLRPPFTGERTARTHEWLDFIDQVLRCGCPPVCLTPYPASAYPAAVRERIALIPFDRRISLRHAREATRRIHRLLEEPV